MKRELPMIQLSVTIGEEEGGTYSAFCEELGLATCGESFEEAERRISKAIDLVLNTATEKDEIWALLDEKGIPVFSKVVYDVPRYYSVRMRPDQWARPYFHKIPVSL